MNQTNNIQPVARRAPPKNVPQRNSPGSGIVRATKKTCDFPDGEEPDAFRNPNCVEVRKDFNDGEGPILVGRTLRTRDKAYRLWVRVSGGWNELPEGNGPGSISGITDAFAKPRPTKAPARRKSSDVGKKGSKGKK